MCYEKSICLVLLVGIPSSGKSFFRTFLESYFKGKVKSLLGSVVMYSISYDNYEKVKNPQCFLDEPSWKEERLEIFRVVKSIVLHVQGSSEEKFNRSFHNVNIINRNFNKPDCILIVLDDNMYYRSMRYEYFKLAKENRLSFCQIYFDIALEKALEANELRSSEFRVPDTIVKSMFNKMEPPIMNHSWEKHSLAINSFADLKNENLTKNMFSFLRNVLLNPVQDNHTEMSLKKVIDRQITNSSAIHQIDIALKQQMSVLIKQEIKTNNAKPCEISKFYSDKRLDLLKKIKNGIVVLPIDLTKPVEEREIQLLKPVLFNLLKNTE